MNTEDKHYFNLLKNKVGVVFLKNYNAPDTISMWKGEEITLFQEDLFVKVKGKVSEKWFYTYFKNEPDKLPRIDMLNLLSEYVGATNWNTFKLNHKIEEEIKGSNKKKRVYLFFIVISIILGIVFFKLNTKNEFQFCFVDDLLNQPIRKHPLDIKILSNHESPISFKTDSLGCFKYSTSEEYIKFEVKSPYYKTDTIVRYIDNQANGSVQLSADDYALLLKYYTDGNVTDWSKHKQKLKNLIDDEATIYQLYNNSIGVEIFTKDDFVRLLTIPTHNLKRIKILEREIENGKIVKLKFVML